MYTYASVAQAETYNMKECRYLLIGNLFTTQQAVPPCLNDHSLAKRERCNVFCLFSIRELFFFSLNQILPHSILYHIEHTFSWKNVFDSFDSC